MKIFLSYARRDWNIVPRALGREQYGFLERLETLLDDDSTLNPQIWRDDYLEAGRKWRDQLAARIEEADIFLILYSKRWIKSENCWNEYIHARDHNPSAVIQSVWFENVDPSEHPPCAKFQEEFPKLHDQLSALHVANEARDLKHKGGSFRQQLSEHFKIADERETRMNEFAEPYSMMLRKAFKQRISATKDAPAPPPEAAANRVNEHIIPINGHDIAFVEVTAGPLPDTSAGSGIIVPKPFLIMRDAVPVGTLMSGLTGHNDAPLIFADLGCRHFRFAGVPDQLCLPNEDQWDRAMQTAPQAAHTLITPRPNTLNTAHNCFGVRRSDDATKEAIYGYERSRRAFADLTETGMHTAAVKWIADGIVKDERKQRNVPLRNVSLRMVLPANYTNST